MKALIVYMSSHGCTEKTAGMLKEQLKGEISIVNLKKNSRPDLADFDTVIVGGSIHAGRVQGGVKRFCRSNLETLLKKKLGLFLCCMEEGDQAQAQFDSAYPEELRRHASAKGFFGGEFDFDRMNFLQRKIVIKITGSSENVSKIKEDRIRLFAETISK